MNIAILGATGNVGSATVSEALAAGHTVTAYVRDPEGIDPRPGLTVVAGSLVDVPAMVAAFTGADAVVSAAGSSEPRFAQTTLPAIAAALTQARVNRFVLVSAFGVGNTKQKASGLARFIYSTLVKKLFTDKAIAEAAVLPKLGMDWTVVYPVNLNKGESVSAAIKPLDQVRSVPGLPTLPFVDVARALVQIVADTTLSHQRLLITTQNGWR